MAFSPLRNGLHPEDRSPSTSAPRRMAPGTIVDGPGRLPWEASIEPRRVNGDESDAPRIVSRGSLPYLLLPASRSLLLPPFRRHAQPAGRRPHESFPSTSPLALNDNPPATAGRQAQAPFLLLRGVQSSGFRRRLVLNAHSEVIASRTGARAKDPARQTAPVRASALCDRPRRPLRALSASSHSSAQVLRPGEGPGNQRTSKGGST